MPDSLADRLCALVASDVYTEKGRLRSDDLLVRERQAAVSVRRRRGSST